MGGGFDSNYVCLRTNAMKELKEETAMLFNVKTCNLNRIINDSDGYIDIKGLNNTYYRSFLVPITGTEKINLSATFKANLAILTKLNVKATYKESTDMTRFFLNSVLSAVKSNNSKIFVNDVNGIRCELNQRTIDIFRKMNQSFLLMQNLFTQIFSVTQQPINHPLNGITIFSI
jgi:hypothetical protein